MKRFAVLVAWVLVLGAAAAGSLSSAQSAVAQQTTESSGLCDTAQVEQFTDVADGDYAAAYLLCMRALGLSVGAGSGTYGPDRELNRAQMASFLVRLWRDVLGKDCPTGVAIPFTDVASGSTHATNIECLYGLEITTGTGADTYGPRDPLKATQISRFLYRIYQKGGGDMCPGTNGSELDRATTCLLRLRVVPTTGEATSTGTVTRAQMGVYVIGLWHNLSGKGQPPPPPLLGAPTPVTTSTTTQPATQPTPRIAYTVTTENGNQELWISDADGANKTSTRLADGARLSVLLWSPHGTHIAYVVGTGDGDQLWVADADGTNPTKITGWDRFWVWSPDGSRVAYTIKTVDGVRQLWVADAGGTNPTMLTDHYSAWSWSPDGSRIAYNVPSVDGVRHVRQLWVADADGTNPTKLTDDSIGLGDWSPGSSHIAYDWDRTDDVRQLWVADADGTNPTKITDSYSYPGLSWSPDGSRIAYVVETDDGVQL